MMRFIAGLGLAAAVMAAGLVASPRKALELILAPTKMGRPYIAPPDVPADRITVLRTAFAATMKDADFLEDAKKLDFEINPTTGEELSGIVQRIYATPKPIVERAAQARK